MGCRWFLSLFQRVLLRFCSCTTFGSLKIKYLCSWSPPTFTPCPLSCSYQGSLSLTVFYSPIHPPLLLLHSPGLGVIAAKRCLSPEEEPVLSILLPRPGISSLPLGPQLTWTASKWAPQTPTPLLTSPSPDPHQDASQTTPSPFQKSFF